MLRIKNKRRMWIVDQFPPTRDWRCSLNNFISPKSCHFFLGLKMLDIPIILSILFAVCEHKAFLYDPFYCRIFLLQILHVKMKFMGNCKSHKMNECLNRFNSYRCVGIAITYYIVSIGYAINIVGIRINE